MPVCWLSAGQQTLCQPTLLEVSFVFVCLLHSSWLKSQLSWPLAQVKGSLYLLLFFSDWINLQMTLAWFSEFLHFSSEVSTFSTVVGVILIRITGRSRLIYIQYIPGQFLEVSIGKEATGAMGFLLWSFCCNQKFFFFQYCHYRVRTTF